MSSSPSSPSSKLPAYPSMLLMKTTLHSFLPFLPREKGHVSPRSPVALLMGIASVQWPVIVTFGIFAGKKVAQRQC